MEGKKLSFEPNFDPSRLLYRFSVPLLLRPQVTIRENAIARMKDHGITPINWTTVAAEMQRDWRLPTGQEMGRVFHDHYHSYGLLMDSFESVTANVVKKAS